MPTLDAKPAVGGGSCAEFGAVFFPRSPPDSTRPRRTARTSGSWLALAEDGVQSDGRGPRAHRRSLARRRGHV